MAAVPAMNRMSIFLMEAGVDRYKIMIAEAVDWMMKYFIEASAIFFWWEALVISMLQKDRVLSSSAIQMSTHEFLDRTTRLLMIRMVAAMGSIRIPIGLITLNCKFKVFVGGVYFFIF